MTSMPPQYRRWLIFAGGVILVALSAAFFWRTTEQPKTPTVLSQNSTLRQPADTRDHELKILAEQLAKKPNHTPVLLRMAQLEHELGRVDNSVSHLRAAIEAEPGNMAARLELGRALYEKGRAAEALAETLKILEREPRNVDALYNVGAIYANAGDLTRAQSYWNNAVAIAPTSESGVRARRALDQLSIHK